MLVLGLEFALSKTDEFHEMTRIGLQDDMTFIGSAAALNRSGGCMSQAPWLQMRCMCARI